NVDRCKTPDAAGELLLDHMPAVRGEGARSDSFYSDEAVTNITRAGRLSEAGRAAMSTETFEFWYRNWRGEVARRRVIPRRTEFATSQWHA
ncbi:hypothetical protein M3M33_14305, partial [Loigolactobacillus coryniformis]|uniref:hypothetical protein n=1 Tax=Loigolactobacillus coryniformis TaxID=1610 RepID=UPI00201AE82E